MKLKSNSIGKTKFFISSCLKDLPANTKSLILIFDHDVKPIFGFT